MVQHEVKKYRQTLISYGKELWFILLLAQIQSFNDKKVKGCKFPRRSEMWNSCYTDKIIYHCIHSDKTIIITLQFMQTKVEVPSRLRL